MRQYVATAYAEHGDIRWIKEVLDGRKPDINPEIIG